MTTDVHALAGAYALHALSDIERAAFARHLAECESCAHEVAELRETAARLADGAWSVPPPRLRDNVLAEIRQTRQLPPGRPDRPARAAAPAAGGWRRRSVVVAAAAAVVLAAGTGTVSYVAQEQRVRDERATAEALRAESARIEAVLAASDARLRTGAVTGGGQITMVLSESRDEGVVMLSGARPPGADRAYQLWSIAGGAANSRGVLPAGEGGATKLVEDIRGMENLGVTIEPASGSQKPTVPVVALVAVED
ncbi:anti-sigma factor [Phytohabitans sp. ZYX-F-186]|uniref:Regulator of SigK n=1 Tax=Phytohabitans maris TaxID=3071409 RepID=A0ABU0ZL71_9ACTN|nr:anti-sigma factor [Phytohabitans sp. ZYX-F-186]MDQ7907142.1 anti-sigma factor [Phytohabitans sp. ZYX-F-186]